VTYCDSRFLLALLLPGDFFHRHAAPLAARFTESIPYTLLAELEVANTIRRALREGAITRAEHDAAFRQIEAAPCGRHSCPAGHPAKRALPQGAGAIEAAHSGNPRPLFGHPANGCGPPDRRGRPAFRGAGSKPEELMRKSFYVI
jgi:hypothetical protein